MHDHDGSDTGGQRQDERKQDQDRALAAARCAWLLSALMPARRCPKLAPCPAGNVSTQRQRDEKMQRGIGEAGAAPAECRGKKGAERPETVLANPPNSVSAVIGPRAAAP